MSVIKKNITQFQITKKTKSVKFLKVASSSEIANFGRGLMADELEIYESFYAFYLDMGNNIIGYALISKGSISGCLVDMRLVLRVAVECLATAVIFVHNHPSGNLSPSEQDIKLTRRAKEGFSLLDIQLMDHIILTPESHFSFANDGLMF